MPSVIIAEDEAITRYGLQLILEKSVEFRLVGEATSGPDAVSRCEHLKPDILLMDLMLPGMMGFDVARQVKIVSPKTRIMVLSSYDAQNYVNESLQSGVDGYVLKGATPELLFKGLRAVFQGRRFLSPPLDQIALGHATRPPREKKSSDLFATLTKREKLVLQLAAEGISSTQIGARLFISPRTAQTHRARLMRKLGLHSQTDLVLFAIRRGILRTAPGEPEQEAQAAVG